MSVLNDISNKLLGEDITPDALPMLESNRSLGYSVEEAISDLIDNSISAKASEINITYKWNDGNPIFSIADNGDGMDLAELINGFKLGSKNPLEERDPRDLGRFGFGMKTASLSQARKLIVVTKKLDQNTICRALDLNFIEEVGGKWILQKGLDANYLDIFSELNSKGTGTVIIWENWDRAPKEKNDFIANPKKIMNYLSVCFHRFLEKGKLIITLNEEQVVPISPIPINANLYSEIRLSHNKQTIQRAFILQHPRYWDDNYLESRIFNSYTLFDGFESQQGIYIYRCDRLLTPKGGWLGLIRNANAAKLARVVIDYPNNADHLWSLDITKTNATIPYEFKNEIELLIYKAKSESIKKSGRAQNNDSRKVRESFDHSLIWNQEIDKNLNSYKYKVDVDHPIFRKLIDDNKLDSTTLELVLNLVSDNLPIAKIIENNEVNPSYHDRMIRNEKMSSELLIAARQLLEYFATSMSKSEAFRKLIKCEPFCYYQDIIKECLIDENA
ncbi:ATP-binding protein [Fulvivirga sedimenti]|uniref:ATP-binding protein n=1 Tax=Fulvivirga sedimenti TaxID=2879465 RepID=A0A9X1HPK1_9BACT|nr:ATP-binding protein [Fulvivirga sedimenti]MCA6075600.1 ATP-binding protein [Fulvivirga sedimenti]